MRRLAAGRSTQLLDGLRVVRIGVVARASHRIASHPLLDSPASGGCDGRGPIRCSPPYEYDNVTLMYAKHEKIPMKDFGSEIRATMDIDHLLNKSVLLLDLQETSLEEIFAKIIHEMDIQEPEFTSEQVRSVLFTQDAGNQFHILSRTVQSICTTGTTGGTFDYDQTWICALCMLNTVQHRHVAIARLSHPTNLGRTMQDLRFIIIVIAPSRAKGTKTALETTRTFATLFADMDIRQRLVMAQTVDQFRSTLLLAAKELAVEQNQWRDQRKNSIHLKEAKEQLLGPGKWYPCRGLQEDFYRRLRFYASDFLDGLRGHRTPQKMVSSIIFLYFACLLPSIAFGVLNDDNTNGSINVKKAIIAQAIGGIFFSIFGGQPMIILLTTVPLAIYIKVIFKISEELGYNFFAMYACVGLWCQFFLVIYAVTEMCSIMKFATRSAEEMFSLFMAIAFTVESFRAIHHSFVANYHGCDDEFYTRQAAADALAKLNSTSSGEARLVLVENMTSLFLGNPCSRDTSILYMLLMFGTLWLGLFLYNFRKTPYLTRSRREILADYSLPASVLIMSFTGAYCFSEVDKDAFKMRPEIPFMAIAPIWSLPLSAYFVCMGLGFCLSFLFFIDQNITSAIINNPQNKLRKGTTQHLDLFVVAVLNCFLSIFGLPWMHGALPHSPLHLRALADVEERVSQGHVHEVITNVRETRLASLIAHVMILMSTFFLLPYPLQWIPTSVLHGLFLYMALTSLGGNEMFERMLLLITEQQAYPPTHYIRKVPQRKVHLFTACQLFQLGMLCAFGFSPYPFIEMVFPIVCFSFLPIRHILIPRLIDYKYLDALDGRH
uniref:Bicarbonate transporter-like transmembrane domain-containing protein n=1 Tax=Plectus sambesii TaxID=2011161 RepID=A0A914UP64_9BILA